MPLLERVAVSAAVPDDPSGRRRREVCGKEPRAALRVLLDETHARPARELAISTRKRRPFRPRKLELVMKHIAQENGAVIPRARMDHDVAGCMAGGAFE